jgi:putative redox protein
MKIVLEGDTALTLLPAEGMLAIEANDEQQKYSPFHMIASALAVCTSDVLHSWASHTGLNAEDLRIHVQWQFSEDPHRLSSMRTSIHWPSLPHTRVLAAQRAADLCSVHATLLHPPRIETLVNP